MKLHEPVWTKNESGFGLIEVLIAAAVVGTIAMVIASTISYQVQSTQVILQGVQIADLARTLGNSLNLGDQCGCNFQNINIGTPTAIAAINEYSGNPTLGCTKTIALAAPNTTIANGLTIKSIEFADVANIGTGLYAADILVNFSTSIGPARKPLRITRLYFNTSAAGVVRSCRLPGKTRLSRVVNTADITPTPPNSYFPINQWSQATADELQAWNPAVPDRLTVPAGVTRIRLHFSVCFKAMSTQVERVGFIRKNGDVGDVTAYGTQYGATTTSYAVQGHSEPITVVAGDYFQLYVIVTQTGEVVPPSDSCNTHTYFAMETAD